LLQTPDPRATLKTLYELRDPLYTQVADLVIPTGKQSVQSLVEYLEKELCRLAQAQLGNQKQSKAQ
jgi:shikimate kinase